jgi:ribosomal protein S18 acetylase RimI-like enzyme
MIKKLGTQVRIRPARRNDLRSIAEIGAEAFSGLRPYRLGMKWVQACYAASPRMAYWVAEVSDPRRLAGYILWMEKGGFREEAVFELEQIAIRSALRGKGIGRDLVLRSLHDVEVRLRKRGSTLKIVEVTTGSSQKAVEFYRRILGAAPVAKIPDLFRGDEFVLISRRGE